MACNLNHPHCVCLPMSATCHVQKLKALLWLDGPLNSFVDESTSSEDLWLQQLLALFVITWLAYARQLLNADVIFKHCTKLR